MIEPIEIPPVMIEAAADALEGFLNEDNSRQAALEVARDALRNAFAAAQKAGLLVILGADRAAAL